MFARFVANVIDVFASYGVLIVLAVFSAAGDAGLVMAIFGFVGAVAGWLWLLAQGITPGKAAMGLRVRKTNGDIPGLGTMLIREVVGKFVSSLFLYIGFLWAVFDADRQAWHDKIAGTVVVKMISAPVASRAQA